MTMTSVFGIGEYVYFEDSPVSPFQVWKIEEIDRMSSDEVEVKAKRFYRRCDLSPDLIEHHTQNLTFNGLPEDRLRLVLQRELFASRRIDTIQATQIRGKCTVLMRDDSIDENLCSLLAENDAFFYQLNYDPVKCALKSDKGHIQVGSDFQATIPDLLAFPTEDNEVVGCRETLLWSPPASDLPIEEVDSYLVLCRSLGTMARAMDPAAALRHQTLVATATAASRDATTELALETLAGSGFSVPRALARLADGLVRLDALETFSLEEADLFTRGCHKYGKAFRDIHAEFLPWKSLEDIIEFYYLWKTSAHYLQRKRLKQSQTDTSLKQFCITNFNKIDRSNEFSVGSNEDGDSAVGSGSGCRGCGATKSDNWFGLGPPKCIWKVCLSCWNYWRRYGDLKAVSVYDHFGPLTVVYKCPVSNCLEESSDRTCLAVHLNAVHPQLGGAYATQVKPTLATQRTTRKAGASHSTAFTFMSSLHLRLVRRMDSRRACRMRARRPYQPARAQLPKLRSLLVTRLGADPGFISRLAQSVRRVKPVPTVAAAEVHRARSQCLSLRSTVEMSLLIALNPLVLLYLPLMPPVTPIPTMAKIVACQDPP